MSKQLGKEKLCGLVTLTVGTVASVVFKRNTEIFTISYLGVFEMVLLEWNHVRKEPGAKKKKKITSPLQNQCWIMWLGHKYLLNDLVWPWHCANNNNKPRILAVDW
jgi:hypothetical protein